MGVGEQKEKIGCSITIVGCLSRVAREDYLHLTQTNLSYRLSILLSSGYASAADVIIKVGVL